MTGRKLHPLVLCGSLTLAMLTGCQDHSSPTAPSPEPSPQPTENVSLFAGGQCHVATNTIVCRDLSRSEPQNRIKSVEWELVSSTTGIPLQSTSKPSGADVSFPGLAPGIYQVDQTVIGQDGAQQARTYGPLSVGGF
jgi:hypothetical protein